jgi:mono/diheme cytochrome c family protein
VYAQQCAGCHGELDVASGPLDAERDALPAYYAGHRYLRTASPQAIRAAVLFGVPGTGMVGLGGALSDEELESLLAYIASFES